MIIITVLSVREKRGTDKKYVFAARFWKRKVTGEKNNSLYERLKYFYIELFQTINFYKNGNDGQTKKNKRIFEVN